MSLNQPALRAGPVKLFKPQRPRPRARTPVTAASVGGSKDPAPHRRQSAPEPLREPVTVALSPLLQRKGGGFFLSCPKVGENRKEKIVCLATLKPEPGTEQEDDMQDVSRETLKRMAEAVPAATYTCQGCSCGEDTDLRLDPIGELWVCDAYYSDVEDEHGDQGPAIHISALPRLLAEKPCGS